MDKQFNPPFDRSSPCPMCQMEVRDFAATLHNLYMRWCEGRMWEKLADIHRYHREPIVLRVSHRATEGMEKLRADLCDALNGMTIEGLNICWTPEVRERVLSLGERIRECLIELEPLSEAHFHDYRHSHGEANILRESRGGKGDLYKTGKGYTDYHYTVEEASIDGDIRHDVCGAHLRLHDHFKKNIAVDPEFYGLVWCPKCRTNAPIFQFSITGK